MLYVYIINNTDLNFSVIDWFTKHNLDTQYDFKVAYFMPPAEHMQTVAKRANMPNDAIVRQMNKCNVDDFYKYDLNIDFALRPIDGVYDKKLTEYIKNLHTQHTK